MSRERSLVRRINETKQNRGGMKRKEKEMTTANTKATEEAQIRTLIDNWANALRTKNANGVVSQYAPDSIKFILAPPESLR
jgi:hypothetical protein